MASEQVLLKHAVGLETTGNRHTPFFVRGLHLPVAWTKMLSTAKDDQDEIEIHVLQGDSLDVNECRLLASLKLSGFYPGQKAGVPKLWLTFQIDVTGRFYCHVVELPDHPVIVEGIPEPVEIQLEKDFTGYGGLWGTQSSVSEL